MFALQYSFYEASVKYRGQRPRQSRNFPEKYSAIIRKLQKAVQNTEIKKKMELEDGIIDEIEDMEREIEDLTQENEQVKQKLDVVEQEKQALLDELDQLRRLLNSDK